MAPFGVRDAQRSDQEHFMNRPSNTLQTHLHTASDTAADANLLEKRSASNGKVSDHKATNLGGLAITSTG